MGKLIEQHQIPEKFYFDDDGYIPNSQFPLLLYRNVITATGDKSSDWFEETFKNHDWTNAWRWGIYDFHHYHSNTHEVLGVYQGNAKLLLGGENGSVLDVKEGDVIIIPAGVGHKCLSHTINFSVVGAYPHGASADMNRGDAGERPKADLNIGKVPLPSTDPLTGKAGGLLDIWKTV